MPVYAENAKLNFSYDRRFLAISAGLERNRAKKSVDTHINFHLYHYAGNNPVKYVDPDGNQDFSSFLYNMFAMSCGNEAASYIINNESSIKLACTAESAFNGDTKAQQIMKEVTKESAKNMAAESLEISANIAAGISEITGDLSMEAVLLEPRAAGGLATASTLSSLVESGSRFTKASITKDEKDIIKAKKISTKNIGSIIVGSIAGKGFGKNLPSGTQDIISGTASKVFEKSFEKATEKIEE